MIRAQNQHKTCRASLTTIQADLGESQPRFMRKGDAIERNLVEFEIRVSVLSLIT